MEKLNKKIVQKIKNLPKSPGVYIFRNEQKRIIYVGKAVSLKNRVSSYFKDRLLDPKTVKLVENIVDLETIICGSEIEALLLESELIKRYKPKYNIEWKDDKNYSYIRITKENYPRIFVVRQIPDSQSQYFGPFVDVRAVKNSLKILRKIFPYCTCKQLSGKVCLYYHLGLCKGHGEKYISPAEYQAIIKDLVGFLSGRKERIVKKLRSEMTKLSRQKDYEKAAIVRDKLFALDRIRAMHVLENQRDLNLDKALFGLKQALDLKDLPARIECYDISNISGQFAVGSMIVFENGLPRKNDYKRFEIKTVKQINDTAMLEEVLGRRFSNIGRKKDSVFSRLPDLIIMDGGKGQLSSASLVIEKFSLSIPIMGLAKKNEEAVFYNKQNKFETLTFKENSEVRFLLQRMRDEAHRFAITYHRSLRSRALVKSTLDSIGGIGPIYKKRLIKKFGTIEGIRSAKISEISEIVGQKLAYKLKKEL